MISATHYINCLTGIEMHCQCYIYPRNRDKRITLRQCIGDDDGMISKTCVGVEKNIIGCERTPSNTLLNRADTAMTRGDTLSRFCVAYNNNNIRSGWRAPYNNARHYNNNGMYNDIHTNRRRRRNNNILYRNNRIDYTRA